MKQGFSLLELSIVLAVIGLITGGIVAGGSMMRNAELQSIVTDLQKFKSAVATFQKKYEALPGDMPDAIDYWGAAHATPATCATTVSTGVETCNGNGNGLIISDGNSHEAYRFWQHLSNAELLKGSFTGVGGNNHIFTSNTENSPSTLDNGIWFMWNWGTPNWNTPSRFDIQYDNYLLLGGAGSSWPFNSVITPKEAWGIDKKIDDAKPALGQVIVTNAHTCTDANNGDDLDADYDLAETDVACGILFPRLF